MQVDLFTVAVYGSLMAAIWLGYSLVRSRRTSRNIGIKAAAFDAGLTEPFSLHPAIDPMICLGCGACGNACPEGGVIGLIGTTTELIEPTRCIGHGACSAACPTGAITLVFGTATRGIDLPKIGPDFQTNVPGLFIAGELGGMGLIRNAVEQGRQAVESIHKLGGAGDGSDYDLVIVGSGPAGLAAALAAKFYKLRYLVIEQDDLGGAVFKYPRGKVVMTAPAKLPIVGSVNFRETTKEALLEFWRCIEKEQGLKVRYRERVERIENHGGSFSVHTTAGVEKARYVLLAIGRRGTPRKLGVPGEELEKVVYQLVDPQQYRGRSILVVGGGDSALEAASGIAEQPGTAVTLSYRGAVFSRAKQANRDRVDLLSKEGRLRVMLGSTVKSISSATVDIEWNGRCEAYNNDFVIVCAGGTLPTEFLKSAGVDMETKFGTA
jgi:thioredoxin reductase (NADPH)